MARDPPLIPEVTIESADSAVREIPVRPRILVVDDDPNIVELLRRILAPGGFVVETCTTGTEALRMAAPGGYDVILLDAVLPDIHGFEIARTLRREGRTTPILMLTGMSGTDFLVDALDAGADDFLQKPFNKRELVARLRALCRRGKVVPQLELGAVTVDPLDRTLVVNGIEVRLTGLELRIVMALCRSPGVFMSRSELLEVVWHMDFDPGTNLLYSHITNIRKKLEAHGIVGLIESVRGKGYRLVLP